MIGFFERERERDAGEKKGEWVNLMESVEKTFTGSRSAIQVSIDCGSSDDVIRFVCFPVRAEGYAPTVVCELHPNVVKEMAEFMLYLAGDVFNDPSE